MHDRCSFFDSHELETEDRAMSGNRISVGFFSSGQLQDAIRGSELPSATLLVRLTARLRAQKLDRILAVGVPARTGSALAVHAQRVTSVAEREALARTLRRAIDGAQNRNAPLPVRIPLNIPNITAAQDRIDDVTLRLHSPRPVSARGMARLRLLLGDGAGPLYRYGRGDLEGRLGAALAAL
jgi:hypothetical protein